MLTIRPHCCLSICGAAAWLSRNGPVRLTSSASCQASWRDFQERRAQPDRRVVHQDVEPAEALDHLFDDAAGAPGSHTSSVSSIASTPNAAISSAVWAHSSQDRCVKAMFAPRCASARADGPADPHPAAGDQRNLPHQGGGQCGTDSLIVLTASLDLRSSPPIQARPRSLPRISACSSSAGSSSIVTRRASSRISPPTMTVWTSGAAGVVDQRRRHAVHRLAASGVQVDEGDVGRRAGRQPTAQARRPHRAPASSSSASTSAGDHRLGIARRRAWPARRRSWRTPAGPASCSMPDPSVPSATGMPRSSIFRTGAAPEARYRLLVGQWTTVAPDCGDQVELGIGDVHGVDELRVRAQAAQVRQPLDMPPAAALPHQVDFVLRLGHMDVRGNAPTTGQGRDLAHRVVAAAPWRQRAGRHPDRGPRFPPCQVSWSQREVGQDAVERLAARPEVHPAAGQHHPHARPVPAAWRPRPQSHGPAACDAGRRR